MAKFTPGVSGNSKGRPPGTTSASRIRKQIETALPTILQKVIKQAESGDTTAAKILLDRVCPSLKPQAMPISLPAEGSLVEQGNEVIQATLAGNVPPDIGSQLITALSNQGKLIELHELAERLTRIENQLEHKP